MRSFLALLLSAPTTPPSLSIFSVAPSAPALGCDVFLFFFIFTHLLRFSGGKVGLNPDFFEAREMILLWRIGPLKTSLNSSWCCKVTENLLRAGGPQCDASGLGTNWLCRLEDRETSREGRGVQRKLSSPRLRVHCEEYFD